MIDTGAANVSVCQPLLDLVPYATVLPSFLDPGMWDVDGGARLARVASTPSREIREYLTTLSWIHKVPHATGRYGDGSADMMRELGAAVRTYFGAAIDPYWSDVRAIVDSDRSVRARTLLGGGVDRLFNTLHHTITWRPPVLRVELANGYDGDLHLGGRGLRLQASVFAGSRPALWGFDIVDAEPLTLVYPAFFDGQPPARTAGRRWLR